MRMLIVAVLLASLARSASGASAPEPPDGPQDRTDPVAIEVFTAPTGLPTRAVYPSNRRHQQREGWVGVNFMVDPAGHPYEVAVTDSIGDPEFERAAIEAIERSVFEPARLDGRPIDAGRSLYFTFQVEGTKPGARRSFVRAHRQILEAIAADERETADRLLTDIEPRNLYEEAYANLARYSYARRWGTALSQLTAVTRATRHEGKIRYLPDDQLSTALQTQFALQLEMRHFAAALKTWEELQEVGISDDGRAALQRAAAEIEALRDDARAFTVHGHIGPSSSWFHALLKPRFAIDVAHGEVAELKLRCDRNYVMFRFQPDLEYRVADGNGQCTLQVIGDPGTRLVLVQR